MLGHQSQAPIAKGPWIDRDGARERDRRDRRATSTCAPRASTSRAEALSGGNQQKLIIGRELMAEPTVLVAAHPTRGVDVGAQAAIWDQLRDARRPGLAMLLISADLEELIGLSDTLLVIFEGRLVAKLDPATATPERARLLHDRRRRRRRRRMIRPPTPSQRWPPPVLAIARSPWRCRPSCSLLTGYSARRRVPGHHQRGLQPHLPGRHRQPGRRRTTSPAWRWPSGSR